MINKYACFKTEEEIFVLLSWREEQRRIFENYRPNPERSAHCYLTLTLRMEERKSWENDRVSGLLFIGSEMICCPPKSLFYGLWGAITVGNHGEVEAILKTVINRNCNCSPFVGLAAIRRHNWPEIVSDRGRQETRKSSAASTWNFVVSIGHHPSEDQQLHFCAGRPIFWRLRQPVSLANSSRWDAFIMASQTLAVRKKMTL